MVTAVVHSPTGVLVDSGPHAGVLHHCGDPLGESRAAVERAALLDRSYRAVLDISGPDRLTWLNTLLSQELLHLSPGESTEALNLDAQGRVLHHVTLTATENSVLLDTEPSGAEALCAYLTQMVFWSQVTVTPRPDWGVLTLAGPHAASLADSVLLPAGVVRRQPLWPHPAEDFLGPTSALTALATALQEAGAVTAGDYAWTALRVAACRPQLEADTTSATIAHEVHTLLPTAVHLHKGCYRGQETVSRVDNLGKPPWRLVLLHLDGSASHTPQAGDPVTAGGRTVGTLTTVIDHHDLGLCALARVKSAVTPDTALLVGDAAAVVDHETYPAQVAQAGRVALSKLTQRGPDATNR